jgi:alkylated DNA nucleotide flippase Atl1
MCKRGDGARFSGKPRSLRLIDDVLREQDLDCHRSIQAGVASTVDLTHAARAERRDDFIRS